MKAFPGSSQARTYETGHPVRPIGVASFRILVHLPYLLPGPVGQKDNDSDRGEISFTLLVRQLNWQQQQQQLLSHADFLVLDASFARAKRDLAPEYNRTENDQQKIKICNTTLCVPYFHPQPVPGREMTTAEG